MAARKGPHYVMGAEHRDKIKNSNILNALIEHVEGERPMTATQVSAGLGLLRKVMPDLASTEHSGEIEQKITQWRWLTPKDVALSSIAQESSSSHSMNGQSDGESSSPTDEPEKQSPASTN